MSYHTVDLKRQNPVKVRTDKPRVSYCREAVDEDVRKSHLEKPRFELRRKVYSDWE